MSRLRPEHPAARVVVDEQGRVQSLGLSEAEVRLECVKLVHWKYVASSDAESAARIVSIASTLADFVLGTAPAEPVNLKTDPSFKAVDFPLADKVVERLKLSAEEATRLANAHFAAAKAPERPALSDAARQAIRDRLESQRRSLKHAEEMAKSNRGYASERADSAQDYENAAEAHREAIALLLHDLGETPPA